MVQIVKRLKRYGDDIFGDFLKLSGKYLEGMWDFCIFAMRWRFQPRAQWA